MSTIAAVLGRILISLIFLVSGANKLMDVPGTESMMTGVGLPSGLAIAVAIFEVAAGLCLAFGVMTRLVAILLAGSTVLTILFFHNRFTDPAEMATALRYLAIIGGLFLVFAHSQMWWSWDAMRRERRGEIATHKAETRAHEAEVRAARAEATTEAMRTAPVAVRTVETDVNGDVVADARKRRWFWQ